MCLLRRSRASKLELGDVARRFQLIQWVPRYWRDNLEDGRKVLLLRGKLDNQWQLTMSMLR